MGGNFTTLPNQLSLLLRLGEAFHTGRGLSFDERAPSPLRMLSSLRYCRPEPLRSNETRSRI